jgi:UDP-N-acetylmuramate dehydrogenase
MKPGREALEALERAFPNLTRTDHPLAGLSAYKVGGKADLFVEPQTPEQVGTVLRLTHEAKLPLFVLGGGTNLLIRDGGIRGVVMHMGTGLRCVRIEGRELTAGAVATMTRVAMAAEQAGLEGLEFGFDIPGTVGGALRMNAGAHGGEIQDVFREARGYDRRGNFLRVTASEVDFGYRSALYPAEIVFTEAVFGLRPGDRAELAARRERNHAFRLRTQPRGKTAGSVFKNPSGDHAGRLVEAAGFKGHRIGGAVVSEKHANWILNDRNASANDIESLIRVIRREVRDRFGIDLQPEVRIVGEPECEREPA